MYNFSIFIYEASMEPTGYWNEETRVKAYEADVNGLWKPAAFLQAMQEAAANHAAALGFDFERMQAREMVWVLSRVLIRFRDFPRMGETVRLRTWPKGVQQKLFFTRDFILTAGDGRRVAEATTGWLLIQPRLRRILPPVALDGKLPPNTESAIDDLLEKIAVPEGLETRKTFEAQYSAVDVMGHANSARYVEWLCDCFPFEELRERRLASLQINFSNEVRPGEALAIGLGAANGKAGAIAAQGTILSDGRRAFEARLEWSV